MADQSQGDGWWQASDQKWYPPQGDTPAAVGAACRVCGAQSLASRENQLTTKKRVKFGVFWILFSIVTLGLGLLVWLVWPRKTDVTGVDRWMECQSCNARQT